MLSNRDMAKLKTRLQVPMVVTDILKGDETLTDDVQYGLHEVISDLQPDSALLAIAISASSIARIYSKASPGMKVLGMECDKIIEDYGSIWLRHAQNESPDQEEILDILAQTPEDLEGIAELLEVNACFLKAKDAQAAALCEILLIQAQAHALIADEFMNVAHNAAIAMNAMPVPVPTGSNVIPFPVQMRA